MSVRQPPREAEIADLPTRATIARVTGAAFVVALLVLAAGVLPAEYGRDPLGLGRIVGTSALWSPPQRVAAPVQGQAEAARFSATPFRSDVIDVPLKASGDPERGEELEYKVHLPKGGSLIYSWSVKGVGHDDFYSEFHGETTATDKSTTVAWYHKMLGTGDNGTLTAPFDGIHGWFFQNSGVKPVTVRLRLAGFYTLIPDGAPGNEVGLHAREVAAN